MKILNFTVKDNRVALNTESSQYTVLTGGNKDYLCYFAVPEDWGSLKVYALFSNTFSKVQKTEALADGTCTIPVEVLTYGDIEIYLFVRDGVEVVDSTAACRLSVRRSSSDYPIELPHMPVPPIPPAPPSGSCPYNPSGTTPLPPFPSLSEEEVSSAYVDTEGHLIVVLGDSTFDCGQVRGEQGPPGPQGERGDKMTVNDLSAEDLEALRGPQGIQGIQGERGPQGERGLQGERGVAGPQGERGLQGEPFRIAETYPSVAAMMADYSNTDVLEGSFVMITSNVEDPDNAKVYVKTDETFSLVTDLSGATGIQGPQGERGLQGEPGLQGLTGERGLQGDPGPQGIQGIQGPQGIGVKAACVDANGDLQITLTNDVTLPAGHVLGATGVGVSSADINEDGNLVIHLTNGNDVTAGHTVGAQGATGDTGVGISNTAINANGDLIITLTNGVPLNAGHVTGEKGDVAWISTHVNQNGELEIQTSTNMTLSFAQNVNGELVVETEDGVVYNCGSIRGPEGIQGERGVGVQSMNVDSDGDLWVTLSDNTSSNLGNVRGPQGDPGPRGQSGQQGAPGADGSDGNGIVRMELDEDYCLHVYYTNGTDANIGYIRGARGEDGPIGRTGDTGPGFTNASINVLDHLVLTKTDGTDVDLGSVRGATGASGVGIASATLDNNDHLILTKTDNTPIDVGNVRGAAGLGIQSITFVDGYMMITYTDGSTVAPYYVKGDVGLTGATGPGFKSATIDANDHLVLTKTDDTPVDLGSVRGATGATGNGIQSASMSGGNLTLTYTDGSSSNAFYIKGDTGDTGQTGATGPAGVGIASATVDANNGHLVFTKTDTTTTDAGDIVSLVLSQLVAAEGVSY